MNQLVEEQKINKLIRMKMNTHIWYDYVIVSTG